MMLSKNESKFIKSLKLKKYRQQERCFLVEGEKNVEEVLASQMHVRYVVGTAEFLKRLQATHVLSVPVYTAKRPQLESLGSLKSNQHGLAVVEMPTALDWRHPGEYILALDQVSDPGNLGTIVRTMDWFGFDTLLCSEESADFYNPKTIAASMGSFTRILPVYCDLPQTLAALKKESLEIHGLVLDGDPLLSRPLVPGVYVMGSESHGISTEVMALLDHRWTITTHGQAESLNVAIATALLLYEIRRP